MHNNLTTISIFYLTCRTHNGTFKAGLGLLQRQELERLSLVYIQQIIKGRITRQTKPGDLRLLPYMVPEWLVGLTVSCTAAAILHNKL
jgi:hypothetical protein